MSDNNVLKLSQPSTFSDPLTEVLRSGARSLLARAVEAEVAAFLDGHSEARTEEGRRRLVRHGHLPEREIMTGIGPVAVRAPRVRDRTGQGADRIRFSSALLPPYARRSKSLEVLIPVLYLKGISTGDFAEALAALLGPDAGGLSASTVARLTEVWADEHAHWLKRDLSARHYVYFWADGIHVQARLEDDAQCLLVIIGATPEGKKELVGLIDGVRESAQSWRELLLDLKRRGLAVAPELAIADGALGFWKAIEEVWPRTRSQRCWVHKTANVLNKLPKSQHSKAKRALQDRATRLAFYDFPAEHWNLQRLVTKQPEHTTRPISPQQVFVLEELTRNAAWRNGRTRDVTLTTLLDHLGVARLDDIKGNQWDVAISHLYEMRTNSTQRGDVSNSARSPLPTAVCQSDGSHAHCASCARRPPLIGPASSRGNERRVVGSPSM